MENKDLIKTYTVYEKDEILHIIHSKENYITCTKNGQIKIISKLNLEIVKSLDINLNISGLVTINEKLLIIGSGSNIFIYDINNEYKLINSYNLTNKIEIIINLYYLNNILYILCKNKIFIYKFDNMNYIQTIKFKSKCIKSMLIYHNILYVFVYDLDYSKKSINLYDISDKCEFIKAIDVNNIIFKLDNFNNNILLTDGEYLNSLNNNNNFINIGEKLRTFLVDDKYLVCSNGNELKFFSINIFNNLENTQNPLHKNNDSVLSVNKNDMYKIDKLQKQWMNLENKIIENEKKILSIQHKNDNLTSVNKLLLEKIKIMENNNKEDKYYKLEKDILNIKEKIKKIKNLNQEKEKENFINMKNLELKNLNALTNYENNLALIIKTSIDNLKDESINKNINRIIVVENELKTLNNSFNKLEASLYEQFNKLKLKLDEVEKFSLLENKNPIHTQEFENINDNFNENRFVVLNNLGSIK